MKKIKFISFLLAIVMLSSLFLASCGGAEAGQYKDAKALFESGKYEEALTAFEAIKDYEDSKDWIKKCKTGIKDNAYNAAIALLDAGNIIEAYEALVALDGYKDSADKAAGIANQYKAAKLKNAKAGDIVTLGRYEQDNDLNNGTEDIEWIVLDVKDGKAFLVSKYVLDFRPINPAGSSNVWNASDIRTWCNETFYDAAFDDAEKAMIAMTELQPDPTTKYGSIYQDPIVNDKIFLLNIKEANEYFPNSVDRKCEMTEYAKEQNPLTSNSNLCDWWLRVRSGGGTSFYYVAMSGGFERDRGRGYKGIRPAMWVDLGA